MKGANIRKNSDLMGRIGAATGAADGFLTKEDYQLFASKEPGNANIQPHIAAVGNPHDTKTADITESGDKLFVSAAEKQIFNAKQEKIQWLEAFRATDLVLTASTFADVLSLDLTKGTWLVLANLTVKSPLNLGQKVSVKIWDGGNVFASGEASSGALGLNLAGWASIALSAIVVLPANKTIKTSAASSAASVLAAMIGDFSTGANQTANSMRAIKIG